MEMRVLRDASRAGVGSALVIEERVAFIREVTDAARAVVPGVRESAAVRCRIERVVERQWFRGSSESASLR